MMLEAYARRFAQSVRPALEASATKQELAKELRLAARPLVIARRPRTDEDRAELDALVVPALTRQNIDPDGSVGRFARDRLKEVAMLPWQVAFFSAAATAGPRPTIVNHVVATSASFTWPATDIQSGDLLLIFLSCHWSGTATVDTAPSGYTEVGSVVTSDDGSRETRMWVYKKTAAGTEESTTVTMSTTDANECSGGIILRGANTTIEDSGSDLGGDVSGTTPTSPDITAVGANRLGVMFRTQSEDGIPTPTTWTGGTGTSWTTRRQLTASAGNDRLCEIATCDLGSSENNVGHSPNAGTYSQGWVARAFVIAPA